MYINSHFRFELKTWVLEVLCSTIELMRIKFRNESYQIDHTKRISSQMGMRLELIFQCPQHQALTIKLTHRKKRYRKVFTLTTSDYTFIGLVQFSLVTHIPSCIFNVVGFCPITIEPNLLLDVFMRIFYREWSTYFPFERVEK